MKVLKIALANGVVLEGIESFPFEINSMLLDEGVFDGVFTYKIKAPYTDNNLYAFGFANVLEVGKDLSIKYPCNILADGFPFKGDLQIIEVDTDSFGLALNFFYGVLVDQFSSTYLDEMDFGTLSFVDDDASDFTEDDVTEANRPDYIVHANAAMQRMIELNEEPLADSLLCFPIWGRGDKRYNLMRVYNDGGDLVGHPFYYNLIAESGPLNITPRPAVLLINVLKQALATFGLTLSGDFKDYPGIDRLIHLSETNLVNRTLSNAFSEADVLLGYTKWEIFEKEVEIRRFMPHMSVLDLLRAIKGHFFLTLFPDLLNGTVEVNRFDTQMDAPYDKDLTSQWAGFKGRKQDTKHGFSFGYDKSIDSFLSTFNEYQDYEFLPDVANEAALPGNPQKQQIRWVEDVKTYFATMYDENGVPLVPVWQPQRSVLLGQKSGLEEFSKTFLLPGWQSIYVEGDPLVLPLQNTVFYPRVEDTPFKHHKLRIAIWTGRAYFADDYTGTCFYTATTNGQKDLVVGVGEKYYLQFPDFPDFSLFINSREGNGLNQPTKPGVYETFGERYVRFISNLLIDRFSMRLDMTDMLGYRLDLKKRIGNNLFFIARARGNSPVTDVMDVEMWWCDPRG